MNYFKKLQKSMPQRIGRTASGKDVYSHFDHPMHAQFGPKEHMEAREFHASALHSMRDMGQDPSFNAQADHHIHQMKLHTQAAARGGVQKPSYNAHFRNSYNKLQPKIHKQEPTPTPPPAPPRDIQPTNQDFRGQVSQSFNNSTGMSSLSSGLANVKQWLGMNKSERYFRSKKKVT